MTFIQRNVSVVLIAIITHLLNIIKITTVKDILQIKVKTVKYLLQIKVKTVRELLQVTIRTARSMTYQG